MPSLLETMQAEGVEVLPVTDRATRARPGFFAPVGVMIHHTAGTSSLSICINGRLGLPGPLCHSLVTKAGHVHLISQGRANHAGLGSTAVLDATKANEAPTRDASVWGLTVGNGWYYGIEIENLGTGSDPYPEKQIQAAVLNAAALCRFHGWSSNRIVAHREWTSRKPDPKGRDVWPGGPWGDGWPGMVEFRNRVAVQLAAEKEDDMFGFVAKGDIGHAVEMWKRHLVALRDGDQFSSDPIPDGVWNVYGDEMAALVDQWGDPASGAAIGPGEGYRILARYGDQFSSGVPGPPGPKGDTGATGATGPKGAKGDTPNLADFQLVPK